MLYVCVLSRLSHDRCTVKCQAPLSMSFSRQDYGSGCLPFSRIMLGSGLVFLTLREIAATSACCWEHDMDQCPWSAQHRAGHTLPWREGAFWLWRQRARPACMACLPPDYSIGILYAAFILDLQNNKLLSDGKLDRSPSSLTQSSNTKPLMRLNRGTAAARRFERIQVSSASICGSKIT